MLDRLFRRNDTDWEPMVDFRTLTSDLNSPSPRSCPMMMRRRLDGKWFYRAPTEEEIQDYIMNEAW